MKTGGDAVTTPTLRRLMLATSTAAFALISSNAWATNGYFAHGYTTQSKGMAGAGMTLAEGALAVVQNPALGILAGNSVEANATFFMPFRSATFGDESPAIPSGTYESSQNLFLVANMGVNYLIDDMTSVGLVMYGNGGMNTTYDDTIFQNFGASGLTTGVDLAQAFLALNLSRKLSNTLTIGVAPVLAVQWFEAYGIDAFDAFSSDPGNVSERGYDWSYGGGVKAGLLYEPTPWLSLAASYQSKMWMTEFEQYSGLFAEGGDFDIPATVQAGIAVKPRQDIAILLEYQRIFYGDVNAIANTGVLTDPTVQAMGLEDGLGFGWDDMDVFRIGVEYQAMPELKVRAGYSYATQFTDEEEALFNVLAPAVIQHHISFGGTYDISPSWAVNFAYTYAFGPDLTGVSSMTGQTVSLEMDQHEISIGMLYRF